MIFFVTTTLFVLMGECKLLTDSCPELSLIRDGKLRLVPARLTEVQEGNGLIVGLSSPSSSGMSIVSLGAGFDVGDSLPSFWAYLNIELSS